MRFKADHACCQAIRHMTVLAHGPSGRGNLGRKTAFAMAMPEVLQMEGKEVLSYRAYYLTKVFANGARPTWTKGRSKPIWWSESMVNETPEAIKQYVESPESRGGHQGTLSDAVRRIMEDSPSSPPSPSFINRWAGESTWE